MQGNILQSGLSFLCTILIMSSLASFICVNNNSEYIANSFRYTFFSTMSWVSYLGVPHQPTTIEECAISACVCDPHSPILPPCQLTVGSRYKLVTRYDKVHVCSEQEERERERERAKVWQTREREIFLLHPSLVPRPHPARISLPL